MKASGVLKQIDGDFLEIGSLVGFQLVLPVTYTAGLVGKACALKLFTGTPFNPTGSPVLLFDQTSQTHGQILLNTGTGIATLTFTAAGALALAVADYAFRWELTAGGVLVERSFFGRWRHRPA